MTRLPEGATLLVLTLGSLLACSRTPQRSQQLPPRLSDNRLSLTSPAFQYGDRLDGNFTSTGRNMSPPLTWNDVPEDTESFALICEDHDAPSPRNPARQPWVHWVLYRIPADVRELPVGVERAPQPRQAAGAVQGRNSWPADNLGYRGPEPPPRSGVHRYFFRLFALDEIPDLKAGATRDELLQAMKGHILAEGRLVGTYER